MESPIHPLVATLHEIPDPRHPQGRRHRLATTMISWQVLGLVPHSCRFMLSTQPH